MVESEKGSLVMERKWSLVEGKKGSQLKGRQGVVQSPVTSIEKKRVSTPPKSLQEGCDRDDQVRGPFYLLRKPKFWRVRSGAEKSWEAKGGKLLQDSKLVWPQEGTCIKQEETKGLNSKEMSVISRLRGWEE